MFPFGAVYYELRFNTKIFTRNLVFNPRTVMRFLLTRTAMTQHLKITFFVTETPPIQILLIGMVVLGLNLSYNLKNLKVGLLDNTCLD